MNTTDYAVVVKYLSSLQSVQVRSSLDSLFLCGSSSQYSGLRIRASKIANSRLLNAFQQHIDCQRCVHNSYIQLTMLIACLQNIRAKMREMGDKAGAPIEPREQTALLDACVSVAGVIGGGVPGGTY